MADGKSRARMGDAGRKYALGHFGIDRAVESYENLFLGAYANNMKRQRGTAL
jgi:hypothetical protein